MPEPTTRTKLRTKRTTKTKCKRSRKRKEDEGVARFLRLSRGGRKAGQARPDQAVCGHVGRQRRVSDREREKEREGEGG